MQVVPQHETARRPDAESQPSLSGNAIVAFDFIRSFGAQLVVIGHAISMAGILSFLKPPYFPYIQNIGVVIFFVISGILICKSARDKYERIGCSYNFSSYMFDRATRIYSGLIPALIFIAVLDFIVIQVASNPYGANFNVKTFVGNLLFLQDYPSLHFLNFSMLPASLAVSSFGTGRPLWTLAVEWWLYIAFGAFFLPWPRSNVGRILTAAVLVVCLPVVLVNVVHGRGDGLAVVWFIGAGSVWLFNCGLALRLGALTLFLAIASGFLMRDMVQTEYDFHASVIIAMTVIAFLLLANSVKRNVLGIKLKSSIGFCAAYSYTLYLTHYTILVFMTKMFSLNPYIYVLTGIIASNVIAMVLASIGEMKYKQLRSQLSQWMIR